MEILIGGDPEFFVKSKETGELVSAHGLIEGTKKNPIPMGGGHAQVDGMALEINIPPSKTAEEFWDGFNNVMDALKRELPKYEFLFQPVAQFGRKLIDAQPLEARQLGCEPDYDGHTGKVNVPPNADAPYRTASGHIHIGWTDGQDVNDPDHMEACCMLSKQLDTAIGFPSLLWDNDTVRRTLYGKAAAFRPKHYGMEYRTLSNVWLTERKFVDFVVGNTIRAFNDLVEQKDYKSTLRTAPYLEKGDWEQAINAYVRAGLEWPKFLDQLYRVKIQEKQALNEAAQAKLIAKERNRLLKKNGHEVGKEAFQIDANKLAMAAWEKRRNFGPGQVINPAAEIVFEPGEDARMKVNWAPGNAIIFDWNDIHDPWKLVPAAEIIDNDFDNNIFDRLEEEEDF